MKLIPLSANRKRKHFEQYYAMVDDDMYEYIMQWKWNVKKHSTNAYAERRDKDNGRKSISMHRQIMNAPSHLQVDHIDGNGLNNQKYNLRICTKYQNSSNRFPRKGSMSPFVGVYWDKNLKKWVAAIGHNYKRIYIGIFDDEIEAAKARDKVAKELKGEFARLNFPDETKSGAV